jgi:RNA polymerase sigma-70 factor (ECF subfamily)
MSEAVAPEAVAILVDHHRRFLRFLESRVGSRAVAEDILQAAYVKALERGGELRENESAIAWFYRLLRNALVDHYRRRDAEDRALARSGHEPPVQASDAKLETAVCECVHGLIPTLKAEYADILRATEIDGTGVAEVAARLGITAGNAAVRLHRARQALKQRLETACGTCTEHGCLECSCEASQRK